MARRLLHQDELGTREARGIIKSVGQEWQPFTLVVHLDTFLSSAQAHSDVIFANFKYE